MFEVNIYLEPQTRGVRMKNGVCGYVVEYKTKKGQLVTREGMVQECNTTGNRLHIKALTKALDRLNVPCQVMVFTYSEYLEGLIMEWLMEWSLMGWRNSKKERVKNVDLLQPLIELVAKHKFSFYVGEKHVYTEWIKSEIILRSEENVL